MNISIQKNRKAYQVDLDNPLDISIPLDFNGEQPNAFGVRKALSEPCKAGKLIGDTRKNGSCNFEQIELIPHCNGTHTECVGHITNERISIGDCLRDAFIPATLVSVKPEKASEMRDQYVGALTDLDELITRKTLGNLSKLVEQGPSDALIVRTLPNDKAKLSMNYGEYIPPFFSNEAMDFIVESGIKHLLVDLPSIDRIFDDGKLSNHRKFWGIEENKFEVNENTRMNNTVTELIYVPVEVKDGDYLLNLQIAPFQSDASPSRPILFGIKE